MFLAIQTFALISMGDFFFLGGFKNGGSDILLK